MKMGGATAKLWAPCAALFLAAFAATPARPLDLARPEVQAFAEEMRKKHGFDAAWLDGILADAASQPKIIERMMRPAESVLTWGKYRAIFMTPERIEAGVAFWAEHRDEIAKAAKDSGVAPHVIIGILGAETYFGRITGKDRVLDALATLGFDYPPRSSFFRAELEQFLLLARDEGFDAQTVLGSYAGAMGRGQFMPSSYRTYAVDGDGDGKRDLWGSWPDVLASVANYLAENGWRRGEPIVVPASLWFPKADGLVAGKLSPNSTVKALRDRGLSFQTTQPGGAPALFIRVDGDAGPEYRAGFFNFGVITRYNRSVLYALAVNDLGRRIESLLPPPAPSAPPPAAPGAPPATAR
jgi:membrane-bound lytic murein transglycosylase B